MSNNPDNARKARDTLSSIYSFYWTNRDDLESVPSFISDTSADIPIAVRVPTAEQAEEFKKTMKELVSAKETIEGVSRRDQQLMAEAANASTIKRKDNKASRAQQRENK